MRIRHTIFLIISCLLLAVTTAYAQKVGLVLSGGGVRGLAHLGVIKALEEENIPIDFITGTSSGALVGSMYAIGLTPAQMQHVMTRPEFVLWPPAHMMKNTTTIFRSRRPMPVGSPLNSSSTPC